MVTYSETSWHGQSVDFGDGFLAKLPSPENPLHKEFQEFEDRLVRHRDLYFQGKPFPYVKQTQIVWKLYGPVNETENMDFLNSEAGNQKKNASSIDVYGGTIHVRHFFGFQSWFAQKQGIIYAATNVWSPKDQEVGCWIGFHDWSRSGGRRGGPFPQHGQWHTTNPTVRINGIIVEPPVWKNPGLAEKTAEIPFSDENYSFRKPTKISLKKGWNEVLLKVPQGGTSWKWMFTFVPVKLENDQVKEVKGLKFSVNKK
jgi:hypothetical protein